MIAVDDTFGFQDTRQDITRTMWIQTANIRFTASEAARTIGWTDTSRRFGRILPGVDVPAAQRWWTLMALPTARMLTLIR